MTQITLDQWRARLSQSRTDDDIVSVPELLQQHALVHPDRVLLDLFEDGHRITYAQMDRTSNQLARGLKEAGLRAGERMAVMLPNCIQFHVTWMALAKLGCVIVPVNPSYTAREIAYVLGDSGASGWLLTPELHAQHASLASQLKHLRSELIVTAHGGLEGSSTWHSLLKSPAFAPEQPVHMETLLNIQYTSGTTGFPKGCMLTHGYWLTLARSAMRMHLSPHTRFFTAQPFFYMDPFWQLLQSLWSDGTLTAAKKLSSSRFFGWLVAHEIEWAQLPELALKSIDTINLQDLRLKQVFTFGWSASARIEFVKATGVVANESFGMTEIGLGLAMPVPWPAHDRPYSVGVAAMHRQARVLILEDGQLRDTRAGETGELWIRGEHLFKGYWDKPEVNAEVLQDGWFKTGDAFVCDSEGFHQIVGRFKDMIRRSNENIAAREVEAVIRIWEPILDCAAVAVPDATRGEEVKVWLQIKREHQGVELYVPALLAHCREHLAPFKVPRYLAITDEFPRTSSNKIAKHQLPQTGERGCYDRITEQWLPE